METDASETADLDPGTVINGIEFTSHFWEHKETRQVELVVEAMVPDYYRKVTFQAVITVKNGTTSSDPISVLTEAGHSMTCDCSRCLRYGHWAIWHEELAALNSSFSTSSPLEVMIEIEFDNVTYRCQCPDINRQKCSKCSNVKQKARWGDEKPTRGWNPRGNRLGRFNDEDLGW